MPTLVVNSGKDLLIDRLMGAGAEPKYGSWGTGAGSTTLADTALFTEASEARVSGTTSKQTTTTTNDTWQNVFTLTANALKTITNVGTWELASGGRLFLKSDFSGVALDPGEGIQFTLKAQMV